MNRTITFSILVLLIIAVIGIGILLFSHSSPKKTGQKQVTFPASAGVSTSTSGNQESLLNNPNVHPDPYNAGYYYIGYQPSSNPEADNFPYIIRYIDATKYFNIGINQEPIGANRQKAETYLMQLLGATQEQMCLLNYAVYVPNNVNSQFSGTNLGFSFCPGAVKLP